MTTTAESRDPVRSGRARRRLLVVLPVVALVLGAALWWWSHPRAFLGPGNSMSMLGEPGRSVFMGLDHAPQDSRVDLVDVRPRVVSDDTSAQVTVHVCRIADPHLAVGNAYDHVDDICASLREPTGPLEPLDQIVVEVVPQREGEIVIDGLDVFYRTGAQRGTQWSGMHATVEVGPPGTTP
ncbi:hypothetical protein SAMN05216184_11110 [Georgenia satyanarayanai]|uniref:Uncharacterized protein n=1 Tax=Georgenia satyanarayanai TaxID=860221 RepID=A0A2Y9AKB2_9MICO|nr:hypothetical protein [Georgenia satyanarayanai]PYF98358.1 hypothetical protein A8987_11110 [Georgenia satyanarayanai]SSA44951.1 hypothetical protein SAMN05216184_11110 [Georgenia satyanarayanai]